MAATGINLIVFIFLCSIYEIFGILNENIQYQQQQYQHFPTSQNEYFQKEIKFIPSSANWQEKFDAISQAVEEEQSSDSFGKPQQNVAELLQPNDNIQQSNPFWGKKYSSDTGEHTSISTAKVSPTAGSKVTVNYGSSQNSSQSTTSRPPTLQLGQSAYHIPSYASHQHYSNGEKGEILIHRPAPIIVKRPPTKVLVNHPPLIVKPAPVIFHRPPSVIVRPVFVKPKQQSVQMQPIYVKVIKPPPEKIYIKEKMPCDEHQYDENYHSKRRYYASQYDY